MKKTSNSSEKNGTLAWSEKMKKTDEIRIDNLKVFAHHGYFQEEKDKGQNFYVNAVLYTDLSIAGKSDKLEETVHYGLVCEFIADYMQRHTFDLIEMAAEQLAKALLLHFKGIHSLDLEIRKPEAPIDLEFQSVSVKIHRGWHDAFIAFGSNMGDKRAYVDQAILHLREDECFRQMEVSDYYMTEPYGGVEQDDFLNGVIRIKTLYDPYELLDRLHQEENLAGRKREIHWGPRTLDLDILFYDNLIHTDPKLVIPHPDMANRTFVLKPMVQLAPFYLHPIKHLTMKEMLEKLSL